MSCIHTEEGPDYEAALGLAWLSKYGCSPVLQHLRRQGARAVWEATPAQLVDWGTAPAVARRFAVRRQAFLLHDARDELGSANAGFLPFGSDLFPQELEQLQFPPSGLFYRGSLSVLGQLSRTARITIVGTRKPTGPGARIADLVCGAFVDHGVVVASGLALGIDGRAHRTCLDNSGLTVAVMGCGVDIPYPATHTGLYKRMVAEGLVLSELPPGTRPARWTFPHRNRILAALGDAVLVVEGSRKSGALQTASAGLELGRPVFAVPGPITGCASAGCNWLIYEGATPVIDPGVAVQDFLRETRMERADRSPVVRMFGASNRAGCVGERWASVLKAIDEGDSSIDALAVRTSMGVREVTGALAELEIENLVVRSGPGLFIRAP